MQTKNLLMLGGSHSEIPLIKSAQSMGYRVITTGNRPHDFGHKFSDEFINGDFSDEEEMLDIARRVGIDAVCAGCNDFAAISAAFVAEQLGLGGHDSSAMARQVHHKDTFYKLAEQATVPVPKNEVANDFDEAIRILNRIGYPSILKPVDLTGGKGVSVVYSESEVLPAWEKSKLLTRQNQIVIQKLIIGSNHAISSIIRNQKVIFSFIDNEHYYRNKFLVGAASYPSFLPIKIQSAVKSSVQALAESLQLADGLLHLQFMVDEYDNHFFIDICRRAPGDLYVKFVEHATGIPYADYIVKSEAGFEVSIPQSRSNLGYFGRLCLMPETKGFLDSPPKLLGKATILDEFHLVSPGQEIVDENSQKVSIFQLQFRSPTEMVDYLNFPSDLFSLEVR